MKVGTPVKEVPDPENSSYASIYERVRKLKEGEWLPVTFDSKIGMQNFASLVSSKGFKYKMRSKLLTVYLAGQKKETSK